MSTRMIDRATENGLLIDGHPILGTYCPSTMDNLRACRDAGINLIVSDAKPLDPSSEMGRFAEENGIRVLYHLTHHIYHRRITGARIEPDQTEIPLLGLGAPGDGPGIVQVEEELIRYHECTESAYLGCERGIDSTEPARHEAGIITFDPVACRSDVERVASSPNLWGYYVLDDSPGNCLAALRAQYRIIQDVAPRPVGAGYGGVSSFVNFDSSMCDFAMLYEYPCRHNGYRRLRTSRRIQWMLMALREKAPGFPFLAVYQGFGDDGYWRTPTPEQLREHVEDFVREGAAGLVAFTCSFGDRFGWSRNPELVREIADIHAEVRSTGDVTVHPEPPEMAETRFQPAGSTAAVRIPGLVPAWHVIGPFDAGESQLDAEFPPEREIDLDAEYDGKRGPVRWTVLPSVAGKTPIVDMHDRQLMAGTVSYAMCTVESDREQEVQIGVAAADAVVVWQDGNEVYRCPFGYWEHEVWEVWDRERAPVTLPKGQSRFLVKLYNKQGPGAFILLFRDADGEPLDGLRFDPLPH